MKVSFAKRLLALLLAVVSVFNLTPFTMNQVTDWLIGIGFSETDAAEKADMILDIYFNQDLIFLSDSSEVMARDFISEYLVQIFTGNGDPQKAMDALNSLPVYYESDIQSSHPEEYEHESDHVIKAKRNMIKLIEAMNLPEDDVSWAIKFLGGVNDLNIYFLYTEYEGVYRFAGDYYDDNGNLCYGKSIIYYDTATGTVFDIKNRGVMKIGFDCNVKQLSMTNPTDPWQRKFGFNILFDGLGNLLLTNIDTVRVKFNYNGQNKMVQYWKGNYTRISNGGEVGLYNQKEGNPFQYECFTDEEMLMMSLDIYHGDELLYSKGPERHWWLTGYVPGPKINKNDITLVSTITFEEQGMLDAFVPAAEKAFAKNGGTVTVDGMTVTVTWH